MKPGFPGPRRARPGPLACTRPDTSRDLEEAGAALVRAVVSSGAELVAVPRAEPPLADGAGALPRTPEGGPS